MQVEVVRDTMSNVYSEVEELIPQVSHQLGCMS